MDSREQGTGRSAPVRHTAFQHTTSTIRTTPQSLQLSQHPTFRIRATAHRVIHRPTRMTVAGVDQMRRQAKSEGAAHSEIWTQFQGG